MTKPHLCPKCSGWRTVPKRPPATSFETEQCPVCLGVGVLWYFELSPDQALGIRREDVPCADCGLSHYGFTCTRPKL